jgi:hypothetical protein
MCGAKVSDSDKVSEETMTMDPNVKPVSAERQGTVLAGYTVITKSMIGAGMSFYTASRL